LGADERERVVIQPDSSPRSAQSADQKPTKNHQSNRQKPEITRLAHQSTVLRSLHLRYYNRTSISQYGNLSISDARGGF
ncbi:hypothetical protein, partial [Gluconobacter oxydans]|uniref:hypothetical protein n=1 Tax=Gluconobacter oxydans TaxID=442 RepID=UPI0038D0FFB0|nr:hypothetical protein [Gluconobacter oxydans]